MEYFHFLDGVCLVLVLHGADRNHPLKSEPQECCSRPWLHFMSLPPCDKVALVEARQRSSNSHGGAHVSQLKDDEKGSKTGSCEKNEKVRGRSIS